MIFTEDVIKRRLTFDGDGTGEDRRLNVMAKMLAKWINTSDETPEECLAVYDKITAQMALVEHSRRRSDLVHRQNKKQLESYTNLHAEMEQNIAQKKEEIATQKTNLEKAKTIKQNRILYDLLAKAIENEPPRAETNRRLQSLKEELAQLAEEKRLLDEELDTRRKQFHVLSTSANSLAKLLSESKNDKVDKENESSHPEPMSE